MEASKLKEILDQHKLWVETNEVQGKCADLEDARLDGANLINADLEGAILWGANLSDASLTGAKLTGANLYGAKLTGANLSGANLSGANLSGANLYCANLSLANLEYANLQYAYLNGAYLNGAILGGANLGGANLTNTILPDISWIKAGCLVQLNRINCSFYLEKENKFKNFVQDSLGFFIQDNPIEKTFDMLVEDKIIRGIPDWVKYTGLKQIASELV